DALLVRIELRITARYGLVDAPVAEREVEPHLVAFERTANRRVEVPDALDLPDAGEAAILQPLIEIVTVPSFVAVIAEEGAPERVAAFLRNHVDADAAGLRFRRVA